MTEYMRIVPRVACFFAEIKTEEGHRERRETEEEAQKESTEPVAHYDGTLHRRRAPG